MKKIYKSRTDRMIGGVCGGIARAADTDSNIIRLLVVVLAIVTGLAPVIILYFVALILLPIEPGA